MRDERFVISDRSWDAIEPLVPGTVRDRGVTAKGIAMSHGAERAGAVVAVAGAPPAMTAVVTVESCAVGPVAGDPEPGIGAEMGAGDTVRQGVFERTDHGVDHGGQRKSDNPPWGRKVGRSGSCPPAI